MHAYTHRRAADLDEGPIQLVVILQASCLAGSRTVNRNPPRVEYGVTQEKKKEGGFLVRNTLAEDH